MRTTEAVIDLGEKYGAVLVLDVIEAFWSGRPCFQRRYPTGRRDAFGEVLVEVSGLTPDDLPRAAVDALRARARRQHVPLRIVLKAFNNWVASGALEAATATARHPL